MIAPCALITILLIKRQKKLGLPTEALKQSFTYSLQIFLWYSFHTTTGENKPIQTRGHSYGLYFLVPIKHHYSRSVVALLQNYLYSTVQ